MLFPLACHFRRSSRAWRIDQAVAPLAGTPMAPLGERGRGKGEGSRDSLQTLPLHDVAHGLGPVEDAGFFGLLDEGISGRERVMGNVECAGPHLRVSSNKLLQKYEHAPSHDVVTLLSAHNLSDSNFPEAARTGPPCAAPSTSGSLYGHGLLTLWQYAARHATGTRETWPESNASPSACCHPGVCL
jgi:hypothetical protein